MTELTLTKSFYINTQDAREWLEEYDGGEQWAESVTAACEEYLRCVVESNSQHDGIEASLKRTALSQDELCFFIKEQLTKWIDEEMQDNADNPDAPERSTRVMETTEGFLEDLRATLIQKLK